MLRLGKIVEKATKRPADILFQDEHFRRSRQSFDGAKGYSVELLSDTARRHDMATRHIRLRPQEDGPLHLVVSGARAVEEGARGFLLSGPGGGSWWLPRLPVARKLDNHGRIDSERTARTAFDAQAETLTVSLRMGRDEMLDVPLVEWTGEPRVAEKEVLTRAPVEHLRLYQAPWYDVSDVTQFWDYFIAGSVYDPRWHSAGKRWECQQCAYTWYSHLRFLYDQTGKRLYAALRDTLAYAVLISLPSDGRWRHGHWTDNMETHTRFQTDGIHLLLDHYQASGRAAFLEAAQRAADYLISIADPLNGEAAWYLHDTLELDLERSLAGRIAYPRTTAFGKSVSNTLCLNTHVWTLTALARLADMCENERSQFYQNALDGGMRALKTVLSAEPAEACFRVAYGLRDLFLSWRARAERVFPSRAWSLPDRVLRGVLRCLKHRWPRLVMPNGYIERDLERSVLSDTYVPVNLKDLALLFWMTDADWLTPFIQKGITHCLSSGLWHKELRHGIVISHLLDSALLTGEVNGDLALQLWHDLTNIGHTVTVDSISGFAGTDSWTLPRALPDVYGEIVGQAS